MEEPPQTTEELENKEQEESDALQATGSGIAALFGPEGMIMMPIAIILDLVGIILIIFGLDDFFITDIIGIIFISTWMFIRSGAVAVPERMQKRTQGRVANLFRGSKWRKFLTPVIGELIPYVGAFPCWTLAVYYEITS